ncbi:ArsR/SmtB family transcription factor [Ureibacillus sp. NPDC094379]
MNFANVLTALSDTTRLQILNLIATRGYSTATTLATLAPVSRQAIVKHLAILNKAGLVAADRVGREVRYTVCPNQLSETAEWMANLAFDWDSRLKWIKQAAEENDKEI